MELCSYGCGKEAKFVLSNKKLCCSKDFRSCSGLINRRKKPVKKALPFTNKESLLCSYGCGRVARFRFKSGKICCENYYTKCPMLKLKYGQPGKENGMYGKRYKQNRLEISPIEENSGHICGYGCGRKAKYPPGFGRHKWCCESHPARCPSILTRNTNTNKKNKVNVQQLEESNKLCEYGCGQIAKYKLLISGSWKLCCENIFNKCPEVRKKNRIGNEGTVLTEEHKKRIGDKNRYSIEYLQKRYLIFCKEEELRYNPDKPNKREIQVRCTNPNCPNSKEKDGWFTPASGQIYGRVAALEHPNGNGGINFYCSDHCKNTCRFYRKTVDQIIKEDGIRAGIFEEDLGPTPADLETLRQEVLKRDNYKCIYCGEPATHVHHIRPIKLEPFFALDPDYAILCCQDCHYKYGHKTGTECSTGRLASLTCL